MIQLLFTMMIVSLFFPLMLTMTQLLTSQKRFPTEVQDQIGLAQLRRFLSACQITEVYSDELICQNEKEWHLRCSEKNLFLSDGTIIVLEGVNEVFFDQRSHEIWMIYVREEKWKEVLIGFV